MSPRFLLFAFFFFNNLRLGQAMGNLISGHQEILITVIWHRRGLKLRKMLGSCVSCTCFFLGGRGGGDGGGEE